MVWPLVHEIIEQALRFAQGFALDESSAGLEEIDRVGPAGDFLLAPSTKARFRQRNLLPSAYYTSPIFPRWSLEKWQAQGSPPAIDRLRSHTQNLLESLQAPDDHAALIAKGEAWIQRRMSNG